MMIEAKLEAANDCCFKSSADACGLAEPDFEFASPGNIIARSLQMYE